MLDATPPSVGDMAPDFTLPALSDEITLSKLRPKKVVLFFYPKDNTPGCTTEAIDFTQHLAEFEAEDTVVIGISKDSLKKHQNFQAKHELAVELASDQDGTTCEDYGVWKEKKMYGKVFWGIERSTFLVGADGTILKAWRKVKVPGHVDEVLDAVRSL